jgi:tetratricopeptide (TPR) repeat protein
MCVVAAAGSAFARDCTLKRFADLPIVANDTGSPIVSILIDRQPRNVLIDTGGFWSFLDPSITGGFEVRRSPVQGFLGLNGLRLSTLVKVPSVQVGDMSASDMEFFEAPRGYMNLVGPSSFVATLGANWLDQFDVEIDPLDNRVSLFSGDHCDGRVVYWPSSDMVEIPVRIDQHAKLLTIPISLDGKEITALIDTGAPFTVLSSRAAEKLFGLSAGSPGMQEGPRDTDLSGTSRQTFRYQFKQLELGGIAFQNPWLTIASITNGGVDLILGMHQLRGLHLYFAYGEEKLYITTARGDEAARHGGQQPNNSGSVDPLAQTNLTDLLMTADSALRNKDYDGASVAVRSALALDPHSVRALITRAAIHEAKGERDGAIEDLSQAILIDPKTLPGRMYRSQLYFVARDYAKALTDANEAVEVGSNYAPVYIMRSQIDAAMGSWNDALQDITAAMRIDPNNLAAYFLRSQIYGTTGDYQDALADADHVVHAQPKSADALNNRCRAGMALGRFDAALGDCNAAVAMQPRNLAFLDGRAFLHFKSDRLYLAMNDYNAVLKIDPRFATSLYGRGMVKRQMGDRSGGDSDIAAAQKIDPLVAQHFGRWLSATPVASRPGAG